MNLRIPTFLLGLLVPEILLAGTSANYTTSPTSIDAGGSRGSSATYTIDSSVGGVTGLSSAASPIEINRAGYIAELFEVVGFAVGSSPATVGEGLPLQLSAASLLDDGTQTAVNAATVTWSIVSGPITSISSGGLLSAGIVYQDTGGVFRGSFGGFQSTAPVTILNTNLDNFGSYAGDLIDDAWQVQYFGLNNPLGAATADADGTGQNNLFKFVAGLNPLDGSRFLVQAQPVAGQPGQKNIIFSPRFVDRTYVVQFSTDLTLANNWQNVASFSTSDNGAQRTVTDLAAGSGHRFYRVMITKP